VQFSLATLWLSADLGKTHAEPPPRAGLSVIDILMILSFKNFFMTLKKAGKLILIEVLDRSTFVSSALL
jgi:hypothetical protein